MEQVSEGIAKAIFVIVECDDHLVRYAWFGRVDSQSILMYFFMSTVFIIFNNLLLDIQLSARSNLANITKENDNSHSICISLKTPDITF